VTFQIHRKNILKAILAVKNAGGVIADTAVVLESASTGSAAAASKAHGDVTPAAPPLAPATGAESGPLKPLASMSSSETVEVRRSLPSYFAGRADPWPLQWVHRLLETGKYDAVLAENGVNGRGERRHAAGARHFPEGAPHHSAVRRSGAVGRGRGRVCGRAGGALPAGRGSAGAGR
jgi:hypothetical protein